MSCFWKRLFSRFASWCAKNAWSGQVITVPHARTADFAARDADICRDYYGRSSMTLARLYQIPESEVLAIIKQCEDRIVAMSQLGMGGMSIALELNLPPRTVSNIIYKHTRQPQ